MIKWIINNIEKLDKKDSGISEFFLCASNYKILVSDFILHK